MSSQCRPCDIGKGADGENIVMKKYDSYNQRKSMPLETRETRNLQIMNQNIYPLVGDFGIPNVQRSEGDADVYSNLISSTPP